MGELSEAVTALTKLADEVAEVERHQKNALQACSMEPKPAAAPPIDIERLVSHRIMVECLGWGPL